MPAARSVSAEPAVEISWASHSSEKSRLRKTENIDGAAGTEAAVMRPPGRPDGAVPLLDDPGMTDVTGGRWGV